MKPSTLKRIETLAVGSLSSLLADPVTVQLLLHLRRLSFARRYGSQEDQEEQEGKLNL